MVDSQSLGIITNLGFGAAIFLTVLILFDILRFLFPGMYYYREAASKDPNWNNYDGTPLFALPRPSHLPLAWIPSTLFYPERKTVDTHGLDVAMYLRFLATQAKVFGVLTVFTALVLYPTYITAENKDLPEGNSLRAIGIEIASLSNVPDKSPRLWVTLVSEIVVVTVILVFLYTDISKYTEYRRKYRADTKRNPSNYAIIILDIPAEHRTVPAIRRVFDGIFPNSVVAVHLVRDAERLAGLKAKYLTAVKKRERAEWDARNDPDKKRSSVSLSEIASADPDLTDVDDASRVDLLTYWRHQQQKLQKEIEEKEDHIDDIAPMTHAAIVVFNSKTVATCAVSAPIWPNSSEWKISRAAEPRGVNWNRLDITKWTTRIRSYVTFAALTAMTVFWTVPAGFIQALGNFSELARRFPNTFISDLSESNPDFVKFLEGILPPLLLFLALLLIPLLMRFVVSFERIHSRTLVESKIRNYLFLFYVMSNFVYVILIGSVLKKLQEIAENPTEIVSFLSSSVPGQATFLMKYVLINAFLGSALGMLNIGRLLVRPFTMRNARTVREKRGADGIFAQYPFGKLYALCTMVSLISFVYSTIAPVICLVAFLYYCIAYLCTKHLLLYSHRPLFEGGGYLYRDAFTGLLIGLYVHQVSMIGIFILKLAAPQAMLATLSFAFSIWFTIYSRSAFLFRAKHGALIDHVEMREKEGLVDEIPADFGDLYVHPGMKPVQELEEIDKPDDTAGMDVSGDNDEDWRSI